MRILKRIFVFYFENSEKFEFHEDEQKFSILIVLFGFQFIFVFLLLCEALDIRAGNISYINECKCFFIFNVTWMNFVPQRPLPLSASIKVQMNIFRLNVTFNIKNFKLNFNSWNFYFLNDHIALPFPTEKKTSKQRNELIICTTNKI